MKSKSWLIVPAIIILIILGVIIYKALYKLHPDPTDPAAAVNELNSGVLSDINNQDFLVQNLYLLILEQLWPEQKFRSVLIKIESNHDGYQSRITIDGVTSEDNDGNLALRGLFSTDISGNSRKINAKGELILADSNFYFRLSELNGLTEREKSALKLAINEWLKRNPSETISGLSDLSGITYLAPLIQNFNPKNLSREFEREPLFNNATATESKSIEALRLPCMRFFGLHQPAGQKMQITFCADAYREFPFSVSFVITDPTDSTTIDILVKNSSETVVITSPAL